MRSGFGSFTSSWSIAVGVGYVLQVGTAMAQTELDPEREQLPLGVESEADGEGEVVPEEVPPDSTPPTPPPPAPPPRPSPGIAPPPFAFEVAPGHAGDVTGGEDSSLTEPYALDIVEAPTDDHGRVVHSVDPSGIAFIPGEGLRLQSADKQYALTTRFWLQALYFNRNNESLPAIDGADGDARHSFGLRRARVVFSGNFLGEQNRFRLQLAVSPDDVGLAKAYPDDGTSPTTSPLLDAYVDLKYCNFATLRVGQGLVPHTRERRIGDDKLELVDRSIVNQEFSLDRDTGVDIHAEDLLDLGMFRYALGVYAGRGRNANVPKENFGLGYVARFEVLPLGMFDDYAEADLDPGEPRMSVGISYARIQNAITNRGILGQPPSDLGSTDINSYSGDVVLKASGVSALVEAVVRRARRDPDTATPGFEPGRDAFGWVAQAGYVIPTTRLQFAARAAQVRFTQPTALPDQFEYGGGVSYYFGAHNFKLQADYLRLGQQVIEPTTAESLGIDFLTQVRVQLQAGF